MKSEESGYSASFFWSMAFAAWSPASVSVPSRAKKGCTTVWYHNRASLRHTQITITVTQSHISSNMASDPPAPPHHLVNQWCVCIHVCMCVWAKWWLGNFHLGVNEIWLRSYWPYTFLCNEVVPRCSGMFLYTYSRRERGLHVLTFARVCKGVKPLLPWAWESQQVNDP